MEILVPLAPHGVPRAASAGSSPFLTAVSYSFPDRESRDVMAPEILASQAGSADRAADGCLEPAAWPAGAACWPQRDSNEDSWGLTKRKPPARGEGRKRPGGPAAERREEPRELHHVRRGLAPETLYGQLGRSTEAGAEGETAADGGRYWDERSKKMAQQNLRQLLSFLRLLVDALTVLLVELVRFLGESVVQVLLVGLLTAIGEHMLKPLLVAVSNSILQPLLLFLLNLLHGIRDLTYPLIDILEGICLQVAVVLRAFRLVEINVQSDGGAARRV
ncbi:uncharacterized protein [Apteryx mantelli]|uniref:Uncharacterized protein n=1 Tax=Apteryx mantelli TaxID=2696672 RepID=A0ABM4E054_9AVES